MAASAFDVVVAGARCAGAPLATMLAQRGIRVCLVDRARFPSETLSTHVVQPCGVTILDRLGALDSILGAGAVPLARLTLVADDARLDAEFDTAPGGFRAPGLCVRRVALDHLLIAAARDAGAEVRLETPVTGLLRESGRVVGARTPSGSVRAPLVVGADGRQSIVAESVGAREYGVEAPGRIFAWAYFEGVGDRERRLRLGRIGDLAFLASPTDAGLYMAGVCPSFDDRSGFLAARERRFEAALASWPELSDLLAGARRVGPIRIFASWHGYFRPAAGRGWALVGDAGNFKDPTPAQGISDALRHGERLAAAIEAGLGGDGLDRELRAWWRWRDDDAREMHWFAADLGAGGPSRPLRRQIIRDLAAADEGELLLRVLNREIRPSAAFAARRVAVAAARVARHRPRELPAMAGEIGHEARNAVRRHRRSRRRP